MTVYYFEIAYNPLRTDKIVMWKELKRSARQIADHPELIIKEARRLNAPEKCIHGCCKLETYADNYRKEFGSPGHPVRISEDTKEIKQEASTSDSIKYHVRRAFTRLLIEAMHKKEIEINLQVI